VRRIVLVNSEERWENDSEHSFQLALTTWYLIEYGKLNLDLGRAVCLSLVHDLPEVYAGDTYIYDEPEILASKEAREREAIEQIKKKFPGFPGMHVLIDEYEARQSLESRFVYALDKLLPILNIYLDGGRTWQQKGITLDQLLEAKTDKIALASEVVPYYEELSAILKQNPHLFSGKSGSK